MAVRTQAAKMAKPRYLSADAMLQSDAAGRSHAVALLAARRPHHDGLYHLPRIEHVLLELSQ